MQHSRAIGKSLTMQHISLYPLAVLILLTACDKKEILQGKRDEIPGVTAVKGVESSGKPVTAGTVTLTPPTIVSTYVDAAGNKQHNSPNYKVGGLNKLRWKSSLGSGPIHSNIIAAGDYIYGIDARGTLVCLSQKDGKKLWEKHVAPQPDSAVFAGGITADSGIIYIATNVGTVLAVDAKTQKEVWKYDAKCPLNGAPLFVDGMLIVTSIENQTLAIDAKTGKVEWSMLASSEQTTMVDSGAPTVYGGNVICPYTSGEVKVYDRTGLTYWEEALSQSDVSQSGAAISHIVASPVVFNSRVLVATPESKIALYDAESGIMIWEHDIGTPNLPIENSGLIFILSGSGDLVCLSSKDGAINWSTHTKKALANEDAKEGDIRVVGPLIVNGDIAVFSNTGSILLLNAANGRVKARMAPEALKGCEVAKTPIVVNGCMYVTSTMGDIYKIE
ncbi:MAG: PQQ-like beta-propeller repeat protein [Holosporales bacterium]|jgi:outer membrane protein assembly factor BamB|nr:PQQ-like beta-propeller repeat protein [Holosporales bacterium]